MRALLPVLTAGCLAMADSHNELARILAEESPVTRAQYRAPQDRLAAYRPNPLADYFDDRGKHWDWEYKKSQALAPLLGLMALTTFMGPGRQAHEMGPAQRWIGRGIQAGLGGSAAGIAGFLAPSEFRHRAQAQRAADMWRNTGMPGSPDLSERDALDRPPPEAIEQAMRALASVTPKVPMSGMAPEGQLEEAMVYDSKAPNGRRTIMVPKGSQWEAEGEGNLRRYVIKDPSGRVVFDPRQ